MTSSSSQFLAAIRPSPATPDVEDLRRGLLAAGPGPVTRGEIEDLLGAAGRAGAGRLVELLALASGNRLLSCGGSFGPEVDEALQRGRWLDGRLSMPMGLEGCFARVLTCVISGDGFFDGRGGWIASGAARAILDAKRDDGGAFAAEVAWLGDAILRAGLPDPAARALLGFIGDGNAALGVRHPPGLAAVA